MLATEINHVIDNYMNAFGGDVMHLDENGKINEKYTFACYGSRPQLHRSLA